MVSLDTIFDLLSEKRRRYVLYYLEEQDEPVPVTDLVKAVSEWERDGPNDTVPDEKYERIELVLQHKHLPKTADTEFIGYDADESLVRIGDSPAEFDAMLTLAKVIERPGL